MPLDTKHLKQLFEAADKGEYARFKILWEAYVTPDNKNEVLRYGQEVAYSAPTLCAHALSKGHEDIAGFLVFDQDYLVNHQGECKPLLCIAAEKSQLAFAERLIKRGSDINIESLFADISSRVACWKPIPLHTASAHGHKEMVALLLRYKADINKQDQERKSSLHFACEQGREDIVELLLQHKADPNLSDKEEKTPLHIACEKGNAKIIELLLTHRANPNLPDKEKNFPIHHACNNGRADIAELLLNHKADPNQPDMAGTPPLHIAATKGSTDLVTLLLQSNAIIKPYLVNGLSPLHVACMKGNVEVAKMLIKHTPEHLDLEDNKGNTPIHYASEGGYTKTVKLLLEHKTNPNLPNHKTMSLLHIACVRGKEEIVEVLVNYGVDVNKTDENGLSPLCLAIVIGNSKQVVDVLLQVERIDANNMPLEKDITINNVQYKKGDTPLHCAMRVGNNDIVLKLLESVKVDPLRQNNEKEYASSIANTAIMPQMYNKLKEHMEMQQRRNERMKQTVLEQGIPKSSWIRRSKQEENSKDKTPYQTL